jgi:HPt (histidine-containing phosphotransfer) domain-containing protein
MALRNLNGNRAFLARLLRDFAHEHADDAQVAQDCLDQDDREGAARVVHTLKGLAGTLGARDLRAGAAWLEKLLQQGDDYEDALNECREHLAVVVAGLGELQDAAPGAVGAEAAGVAIDEVRAKLESMRILADEMSPDVEELADELTQRLGSDPLAAAAKAVARACADFEFEDAAALIEEMLDGLENNHGETDG